MLATEKEQFSMPFTQHKYIFFVYVLAATLFASDILLASFFDRFYFSTLIPLFVLYLLNGFSTASLCFVGTLLSLESLAFHGRFGLALIYLLPLALGAHILQKLLTPQLIPPLGLTWCLIGELLIIQGFLYESSLFSIYTGIGVCGTLIVHYVLLKYAI